MSEYFESFFVLYVTVSSFRCNNQSIFKNKQFYILATILLITRANHFVDSDGIFSFSVSLNYINRSFVPYHVCDLVRAYVE